MSAYLQEARPPFVQFETRAVKDNEASIREGRYIAKNIDYVLVTPAGSKDCVEKEAETWFRQKRREVESDKFNRVWLTHFEAAYNAWKQNQEIPLNGTPLTDWPGLSPAQLVNLRNIHILTIEDLANANDEAVGRIGMGGRALKDRAAAYLSASASVGRVSEENAALKAANSDLQKQMQTMQAKLDTLVQAQSGAKPAPSAPPSKKE